MKRLARAGFGRLRVGFLIALTLVPLAASGHFHKASQDHASDSCPTCTVKYHAPGASVAAPPASAPLRTSSAVVVAIAAATAHVPGPLRTGRAPPVLFTA